MFDEVYDQVLLASCVCAIAMLLRNLVGLGLDVYESLKKMRLVKRDLVSEMFRRGVQGPAAAGWFVVQAFSLRGGDDLKFRECARDDLDGGSPVALYKAR